MRTNREQDGDEQDGGEVIVGPWRSKAPAGEVADLERPAKEIAEQPVAGQGSVVRWTASVEGIETWRKAARRPGRFLGVPVRTGASDERSRAIKAW